MVSDGMKRRVIGLGVFVLPLVLVKLAGALLVGGPGEVVGDPIPVPPAPTPTQPPTPDWSWSADQLAAAERIAALRSSPFDETPFYYRQRAPDPGVGVVENPVPDLLGDVELQMILTSETGGRALINGRVYRVGDIIDRIAWIVKEIDGITYSVVLEHPETGRRTTVRVRMPG